MKRCSVGSTVAQRHRCRELQKFVLLRVGDQQLERDQHSPMNELMRERRVRPAGLKAFQKRVPEIGHL
jgi:hypothetical protein